MSVISSTISSSLQDDFRAVNQAESEKAEQIEAAKRYRAEILNETGGADFQAIIEAISHYEKTVHDGDSQHQKTAETEIIRLLRSDLAGGRGAEQFSAARAYKTAVIEATRGAAQRFEMMLTQYAANPRIVRHRLVQNTLQTVFSGKVKTFYLPASGTKTIYLELNR